jgi:DNA mismatch repair protein MutS
MHKIAKGGIDKSYGIHVAKLAGVPSKVITRSKEILLDLQKRSINKLIKDHMYIDTRQMGLEETIDISKQKGDDRKYSTLKQKICEIDLNNLSPLDVLNKLNLIQKELKDD